MAAIDSNGGGGVTPPLLLDPAEGGWEPAEAQTARPLPFLPPSQIRQREEGAGSGRGGTSPPLPSPPSLLDSAGGEGRWRRPQQVEEEGAGSGRGGTTPPLSLPPSLPDLTGGSGAAPLLPPSQIQQRGDGGGVGHSKRRRWKMGVVGGLFFFCCLRRIFS